MNKSTVALMVGIVLLGSDAGLAQITTPGAQPDTRDQNVYVGAPEPGRPFLKKFVANFLLDQKDIWTSPFHMNRSSAKWWVMTGAGMGVLLAVDHPISQALPTHGGSVDFGNAASRAGQWYTVFPAAGAMLGAGLAWHYDKLTQTGAASLEALADADLVANVFKVVARRQRPLDGDREGHFEKAGSSFPSGHSTEAWALASVIADEYGNHRWVPYASYGYAALISTSRIVAQEHFSSDVFVGAAVGFFMGRYVVRTQHIHRDHWSGTNLRSFVPAVVPALTPSAFAIDCTWQLGRRGL